MGKSNSHYGLSEKSGSPYFLEVIMVVNILGTEYTVNLVTEQAEPRLEGCDGFL